MFSILLCVNKDNEFLEDAIESVLSQDYTNFEFIIVANNCTDQLFEKLASFSDSRIKLFRTSIGQLSFNLNFGIEHSRFQYIVRMDSDDVCYPDRLSNIKKVIESEDSDFYCFSYDMIDEYGRLISRIQLSDGFYDLSKSFLRHQVCHPTVVLKKSSILKIRGYSGGFQSEDYDLWLRASRMNFTMYMSSFVTLKYRLHESQSRGNVLPYCEVSSYILREMLLEFSFYKFFALFISVIKRIIKPVK
ncbi:glycosyltransferase [Vibrio cholerae]|nr:glycosyltransferase [Vibrio cholerae]ELH0899975.1 glycosyltransferase [Vibrio cholerae]